MICHRAFIRLGLVAAAMLVAAALFAEDTTVLKTAIIRVLPDKVLATSIQGKLGINLNYLRDADQRSRDLGDALAEMSVGRLRYPGGEKSDWIDWQDDAEGRPQPNPIGYYEDASLGHEILGFDDFAMLVRKLGAEPHVVVGYDSQARTGISEDRYLASALNLLRYANIKRGYGIKYWEIGNENWNNDTGKPADLARVVIRFSKAMREIDPSIKIGASGNSEAWWRDFLPAAAPFLDFLTVSVYPCTGWGSYDYYVYTPDGRLDDQVRIAESAIESYAKADSSHLQIVAAEVNSMDFSASPWKPGNTLGHALVTFDALGQLLSCPRLAYAMVWTTRWMDSDASTLWYALGEDNELKPTGLALSLWGKADDGDLVVSKCTEPLVSYCLRDSKGGLTLFVINKSKEACSVEVSMGSERYHPKSAVVLSGSGPEDTKPKIKPAVLPDSSGLGQYSMVVGPVSIEEVRFSCYD